MLKIIDKCVARPAHPAPLLFARGTYHFARCWDEHFLDLFASAGYRAVAISLRGHS